MPLPPLRRLVASLAVLAMTAPMLSRACEASVANHIVRGEYAQAARFFATPGGALDPAGMARVQSRLRQLGTALRLEGQPAPLIRPAPDDTAVVVRVGYEPRTGEKLFFHRAVFLVDSPTAPGLRLAVHTTTDPNQCAVFAVAFEGRTGEARRVLVNLVGER